MDVPIWLIGILVFVVSIATAMLFSDETREQGAQALGAIAFLILGAIVTIWVSPLLGKVIPFFGELL